MPILDIRKLVRSALDRAKQSEHAQDSDPSVIHLRDAVVRSMAELEVVRGERIVSGSEHASPQDGTNAQKADSKLTPAA